VLFGSLQEQGTFPAVSADKPGSPDGASDGASDAAPDAAPDVAPTSTADNVEASASGSYGIRTLRAVFMTTIPMAITTILI
jgi:hypothetical protein